MEETPEILDARMAQVSIEEGLKLADWFAQRGGKQGVVLEDNTITLLFTDSDFNNLFREVFKGGDSEKSNQKEKG